MWSGTSQKNKLLLLLVSLWSFFLHPGGAPAASAQGEEGCATIDSAGSNSGDNVVVVTVHVKDPEGNPVAELVKLEDHGPPRLSDSDVEGHTSADGCLVIFKGTGPDPCNYHKLLLPNRPDIEAVETPCQNAGEFQHNFTVSGGSAPSNPPESSCNIVPKDKTSADADVTIKVHVMDSDGKPVDGELVVVEDHGPPRLKKSDEEGHTENGCLVIYKATGPEPCNNLKLLLPERPDVDAIDLGCLNKGSIEHTFHVTGDRISRPDLDIGECTVRDYDGEKGPLDITVMVNEFATPVSGELVQIDAEDSPDDARTSSNGCVTFREVACKSQTIRLPNRDNEKHTLGCKDGYNDKSRYVSFWVEPDVEVDDAVIGPIIGVPVGVVVLAIVITTIVCIKKRKKRCAMEASERPVPVGRESSDDSVTLDMNDPVVGPYAVGPTSPAQPPRNQPTARQPPHRTWTAPEDPEEPASIFNPVYTWLFKSGPRLSEDSPAGVPQEAAGLGSDHGQSGSSSGQAAAPQHTAGSAQGQGEIPLPGQTGRETPDPGLSEECLVCLDGPRQFGFLHSGTLHMGVCERCLPEVQQRVTECMICRARIEKVIRVH